MTQATIFTSVEKENYGDGDFYCFNGVNPREYFYVRAFAEGIAIIEPTCGTEIKQFAKLVAGCFDAESNFQELLQRVFKVKRELSAIVFKFNETVVTVTELNADADKIYEEWKHLLELEQQLYDQKREAYMKTWEYKIEHARELKKAYRLEQVQQRVREIAQETEIEFKDEEAKKKWDEIVEINSDDSYGKGICEYAEIWIKFMQHLMKRGCELEKIARQTSCVADMFGMSGFSYGCAVNMIVECWKYGGQLRRWHNGEYGVSEDVEGVVNPAILQVVVEAD